MDKATNHRYVRLLTSGTYRGCVARWHSTLSACNPWTNILILDDEGHEVTVGKTKTQEISKKEFFKERLRGKELSHKKRRLGIGR